MSFWKLCVSTTLTVGKWYVASSGSPCLQLFSLLNSNMHYHTHACECRVCWGVMGGVDSGWMVISLLCCNRNRNGPMPNLFIYQRGNHHDKHLSCRFRVESVVIITTKWCLWQWRGYKCRLLINLMTQMSRKEVLIINTLWKKSASIVGEFVLYLKSKQKWMCVSCVWMSADHCWLMFSLITAQHGTCSRVLMVMKFNLFACHEWYNKPCIFQTNNSTLSSCREDSGSLTPADTGNRFSTET